MLLVLWGEPERIVPNWRIVANVWNAYVRVDDVEAVYARFRNAAPASTTRSTTPLRLPRVRRQDPDGYDIAFGQPL